MIENTLINHTELEPFLTGEDLASRAKALLAQQKQNWPLLTGGYKSLETVQTRTFHFDNCTIKVQFNPGRIVSSSAKVDEKSIKERKCFLCYKNLPNEQRGILYGSSYIVLCNPFPIFPEHFTLPNVEHLPQLIDDSISEMLNFSRDLQKYYTVFYNGPKCGASAPDHLHFQAGDKGFMPIDSEYNDIKLKYGEELFSSENLSVYAVDKYLRRFFSFESANKESVLKAFDLFYSVLEKIYPAGEEPMMNVLSSYEDNKWRVVVFPRAKHRPSYYFAEGDENILLSPASVDMGGVLITPLEKDFVKITHDNITDIFRQVTMINEYFEYAKITLSEALNSELRAGNI